VHITPHIRTFRFAALAAAIVATSFVTAQSSGRQPSTTPGSEPLLTEIRELRAELRQATIASLKAQLLAARLQLADQRLSVLLVNLTDARRGLADQQAGLDRAAGELRETEKLLSPSPQALREDLLTKVNALQRRINTIQSEQQRLQGQESELIRQLTAEQGRWSGLNQGLDELERSVTKPSTNR
jgi:ribosomal protein L29